MLRPAHQLGSARTKLQRCEEHLGYLQAEHERFRTERNPYRMLPEEDPEPEYKVWRVKIVEPPPTDKWGSLVGECIHALRSALDHTAYALVKAGTVGAAEKSEFPIFKDPPTDRTHPRKLPGVDRRVLAQVNWLQPHRRGGQLDPLWLIHQLDIIDKHRRINIVSPSLLNLAITMTDAELADFQPFYGAFEDGAILARYKVRADTPDHYMRAEFAFDIAFGESDPPIAGKPVMRTIHELMVFAGGVIARFDRFFK